ncbi:MAG: DUF3592 domain-containing protein [Hyphomicrobiaceae bacterium]
MWKRVAAGREEFASWAAGAPGWKRTLALGALVAMIAATVFALVVMGPRLVREGSLMLWGTRAEAVVRDVRIDQVGTFKGGDPKYRMRLGYTFSDAKGGRFEGRTERNDLRFYPQLKAGDRIEVLYDPTDARWSVADYNLAIDVVALALFLPFLTVLGLIVPVLYIVRWMRWVPRTD